jgi:hypothetical protein
LNRHRLLAQANSLFSKTNLIYPKNNIIVLLLLINNYVSSSPSIQVFVSNKWKIIIYIYFELLLVARIPFVYAIRQTENCLLEQYILVAKHFSKFHLGLCRIYLILTSVSSPPCANKHPNNYHQGRSFSKLYYFPALFQLPWHHRRQSPFLHDICHNQSTNKVPINYVPRRLIDVNVVLIFNASAIAFAPSSPMLVPNMAKHQYFQNTTLANTYSQD